MKNLIACAIATTAITTGATSHAAIFQVTGGSLSAAASTDNPMVLVPPASQTTPVGTSPGIFQANASVLDQVGSSSSIVANGSMKFDDMGDALRIDGAASGVVYGPNTGKGSASGTINFTLSAPVTVLLSFQQNLSGFGASGYISLANDSSMIFGCGTQPNGVQGCSTSPAPNSPIVPSVSLVAGNYTLSASTIGKPTPGSASSTLSFSMTPVPLPLAACLFFSGLTASFGSALRRRA